MPLNKETKPNINKNKYPFFGCNLSVNEACLSSPEVAC